MNADQTFSEYFVGLDLGKQQDHSALAVVARREIVLGQDAVTYAWRKEVRYEVRHLEQFRLATSYGEVSRRVSVLVKRLGGKATLVVDATGVGSAALEMIRRAELGPACWVVPVVITGGERAGSDGVTWHVPKPDLMAVVEVMLEKGELVVAKGRHARRRCGRSCGRCGWR